MASNDNEDTPPTKETFNFGEYVSPNPKTIPFGMKFKPEPEIKIVHKTDSKIENINQATDTTPSPQPDEDGNPYLDQQVMEEQKVKFSVENNKDFENRHKVKKTAATPLKVKVCKQAKEINSLQAELLKLRIENEKLKSATASASISPANESNNIAKHIVFDETVQDCDGNGDDSFLSDNVSKMRATRKNTPFKSKPREKENKFAINQAKPEKKSRGDYRITPIPQQRRRRIVFKSKLQSICDQTPKGNEDKENSAFAENRLAETAATPKHILSKMDTPIENIKIGKVQIASNHSFNLGQKCASQSGTPSFLATPDVSLDSAGFTSTGNGASNQVSPGSPILTPVKGMTNNKRFEFSWNKKR